MQWTWVNALNVQQQQLQICAKDRITPSIWNVIYPSWPGHIWTKEHGLIPVNRTAKNYGHSTCPTAISGMWQLGHCAEDKSNQPCRLYYSALGFGKDNHGPMIQLNTNTSEYLAKAVHMTVCNQYKHKYIKLIDWIEIIKRNITYKIEKVMPQLMPNENAIIYGEETQSTASQQKRAIPLFLIFLGVSAIGGLIMKGRKTVWKGP